MHLCASFALTSFSALRGFLATDYSCHFLEVTRSLLQSFAWLFVGISLNVAILLPSIFRFGYVSAVGKKMAAVGFSGQLLLVISLLNFRRDVGAESRDPKMFSLHNSEERVGSSLYTFSWFVRNGLGILLLSCSSLMASATTCLQLWNSDNDVKCSTVTPEWFAYVRKALESLATIQGRCAFHSSASCGWTCYAISLSMWIVYWFRSIGVGVTTCLHWLAPRCHQRAWPKLSFLSTGLLNTSVRFSASFGIRGR